MELFHIKFCAKIRRDVGHFTLKFRGQFVTFGTNFIEIHMKLGKHTAAVIFTQKSEKGYLL